MMIRVVSLLLAIAGTMACSKASSIEASPPEDAATAARIDEMRARLQVLSTTMEPCSLLSSEVAAIDTLIDASPGSARALHLLGEALQLANESCPGDAPRSRHVASAEDAFARANKRAGRDLGASGGCSPGQALAEGRVLEAAARWADAVEAYRRELYGGCVAGIHWHGRILSLRGRARVGLARAAIHLHDDFEARRQLRLIDLERSGAALRIGDEAEESKLWQKLGPAAPLDHAKRPETPEDALRWLERAAVADDAQAFLAVLAREAEERALLAGKREPHRGSCDMRIDEPVRLRMCILAYHLPEAPRAVTCERPSPDQAKCRVTGAAGDVRVVTLIAEQGTFGLLSSERPER